MADFRPSFPFNVAVYLQTPKVQTVRGVLVKSYPDLSDCPIIYCSWKSYGGTEAVNNGALSVVDTVTVETWFRPDIKAGCRLIPVANRDNAFEILGTPENINMRNQFFKFKVQAVSGGA